MTPAFCVFRPVAATSKVSPPVSSKGTIDTDRLWRALHVVRTKDGIQLRHPLRPLVDLILTGRGRGSLEFSLLLCYYEMVWGKETYYNGGQGRSAGPTLNCCLPPKSITGNLKVKGSGDHTEGSGSWAGRARRGRGAHPERPQCARARSPVLT